MPDFSSVKKALGNFSSVRKAFGKNKELLLNDVNDFFLFMVFAILGTLIFYRQTQDELTATLILSLLWIFFWKESGLRGKVLLVSASAIGYVHELIGVYAGFFSYLGGFFGGVPLWIIPGYGAIFWASYNFWRIFEKTHAQKPWFAYIYPICLGSFAGLFAIDYVWLGLSMQPITILSGLVLSLMLFKSEKQITLAYFVAFFTVFDEIAGELIGTWSHPVFSIFSLMSGYIFLLWMCLTITDVLNGTKKWRPIEVAGAIGLLILFGVDVAARL